MTSALYLDYNATTPVAPEVADAMEPYLREHFGNPSSSHRFGHQARAAVAQARAQVAGLIGIDTDEIVFTSCATEANNLAILGVASAVQGRGRHLITSAIEHPSVAAPMAHL
ncbi:MAG: aminotransferase class V-fold PLP-dependent enzyme, partial [Gammaproteobacteria bacterium]